MRDLADVQQLIETLNLTADMSRHLDESVRDGYLRLWRLAQEAREMDTEDSE